MKPWTRVFRGARLRSRAAFWTRVSLAGCGAGAAVVGAVLATSSPAPAASTQLRDERPAAATPWAQGYWLVASDGGIFSYGSSSFHGSTGNIVLNKPIVGM